MVIILLCLIISLIKGNHTIEYVINNQAAATPRRSSVKINRKNKEKEKNMNWYIELLKKYAVFNGRARRKEYWYFVLFNIISALTKNKNTLNTASKAKTEKAAERRRQWSIP